MPAAMNFQTVTMGLLVAISFAYAAWTLMPQALRAAVARGLLRLPLPALLRVRLLAAANASAGCGCSGCDKAPALSAGGASPALGAQAQPLVFHPRKGK